MIYLLGKTTSLFLKLIKILAELLTHLFTNFMIGKLDPSIDFCEFILYVGQYLGSV